MTDSLGAGLETVRPLDPLNRDATLQKNAGGRERCLEAMSGMLKGLIVFADVDFPLHSLCLTPPGWRGRARRCSLHRALFPSDGEGRESRSCRRNNAPPCYDRAIGEKGLTRPPARDDGALTDGNAVAEGQSPAPFGKCRALFPRRKGAIEVDRFAPR